MKIIFIIILLAFARADQSTCKILAMVGWGDQSAYTVGALKALIELTEKESTQYDVLTGNASAALNAAILSFYEKGQEEEAVLYLEKLWKSIKGRKDIMQNWSIFGILYSVLFKDSLYDSSPLYEMIKREVKDKEPQRELVIGATGLDSGKYVNLHYDCKDKDHFAKAVLAASSIPIVFPAVEFHDDFYTFGDLMYDIDLSEAVNICKKKGFSEENIVIDIVSANVSSPGTTERYFMNAWDNLFRFLEIYTYYFMNRNFEQFFLDFPAIKVRYLISPATPLPSGMRFLGYNPSIIKEMIDIGYQQAKEKIEKEEEQKDQKEILARLANQYK